ncbi:YigZ family protein [Helicobacter suis]|uniref:YigZ family protein n=1 Tax=Helicobacter suis TaxID=104628 RepID=UPI0024936BD1|nr:YigZ family protein [Helicobacter suis]
MNQVNTLTSSKHQIKGSSFLGFLLPFADFKNTLEQLKKEHCKARHIVYAYRYLNGDRLEEVLHEDREPKNSAKPLLEILRRQDLINTAVIVVRYFGGVLLGVGGLIKAYGLAVQLCLQKSELVPFIRPICISQWVSYPALPILSAKARKYGVEITKQELEKTGTWVVLTGTSESIKKMLGN